MMKSMIFALCVLGIAQAAVLPSLSDEVSELKDWIKTSAQMGHLVEIFKHRIEALEHHHYDHLKIAMGAGKSFYDLFYDNQLWAELGEGAAGTMKQLFETLYNQFDHTKFNRARRETEEGIKELLEIEKELETSKDIDAAEKVQKIKSLIDSLEKHSGVMRKAAENESVREIYHYMCEAAGALAKKPGKFNLKDVEKSNKKSVREKICSAKTFDQVKNVLTKGHKFFVKAKEVLSEENLHKVVDVAKKFKNWFRSNKQQHQTL